MRINYNWIIKVAARDIHTFYHQQSNPRARYFSNVAVLSRSLSDAMDDEEEKWSANIFVLFSYPNQCTHHFDLKL